MSCCGDPLIPPPPPPPPPPPGADGCLKTVWECECPAGVDQWGLVSHDCIPNADCTGQLSCTDLSCVIELFNGCVIGDPLPPSLAPFCAPSCCPIPPPPPPPTTTTTTTTPPPPTTTTTTTPPPTTTTTTTPPPPSCTCDDLRFAPKGTSDYVFNDIGVDCSEISDVGSLAFYQSTDCRDVDITISTCAASAFGCGGGVGVPIGTTYTIVHEYLTSGSASKYIFVAVKPDFTVDIFALFPANYGTVGGPCSTCPDGSDVWAAYNVPRTIHPDCSVTIPSVTLNRVLACGDFGTPSLSVSIVP